MISPCNYDQVALHAGQDLPADEVKGVEEHLANCPACQALLTEYRQGISLIHRSQPSVSFPARGARLHASPRWAVAAALTLVLLIGLGILTQGPVVAAALKSIGLVPFRVMEQDELDRYLAHLRARALEWRREIEARGQVSDLASDYARYIAPGLSIEEMEQAAGFHIYVPTYLPEAYRFRRGEDPVRSVPRVMLLYEAGILPPNLYDQGLGGQLSIGQGPVPENPLPLPEGSSETVLVAGQPALLIRGAWGYSSDGAHGWMADAQVALQLIIEDQLITISHMGNRFPVAELIKVAESLK